MANCQKRKVDELPIGAELDTLVAECVMGWQRVRGVGRYVDKRTGCYAASGNWLPSICIAAAWDVLEHLKAQGWFCLIQDHSLRKAPGWRVVLLRGGEDFSHAEAEGKIAPLAICRAALKAIAFGATEHED